MIYIILSIIFIICLHLFTLFHLMKVSHRLQENLLDVMKEVDLVVEHLPQIFSINRAINEHLQLVSQQLISLKKLLSDSGSEKLVTNLRKKRVKADDDSK